MALDRPGFLHVAGVLLTGAWLVAQLGGGGTPSSRAIDQIQRSVTRPMPSLPPAAAPRSDSIWVPDRYVAGPAGPVHVPGHWEQRIAPNEVRVPPLVVCTPGGECTLVPAGVRPPIEQRQSP